MVTRSPPGVVPPEVSALLRPGRAVLVSGRPGVGKSTLCGAIAASVHGVVVVSLAPKAPKRSTAENRADRVARCLAAMDDGRIVVLDACAATPRTLAYWTRRIPRLAIVRLCVIIDELSVRRET